MTYKEVLKNRVNYYINRILELQKRDDGHDYTKAIKEYKNMVEKTLEELIRE